LQVNIILLSRQNKLACSFSPEFDFLVLFLLKLRHNMAGNQRAGNHNYNQQYGDEDAEYMGIRTSHFVFRIDFGAKVQKNLHIRKKKCTFACIFKVIICSIP